MQKFVAKFYANDYDSAKPLNKAIVLQLCPANQDYKIEDISFDVDGVLLIGESALGQADLKSAFNAKVGIDTAKYILEILEDTDTDTDASDWISDEAKRQADDDAYLEEIETEDEGEVTQRTKKLTLNPIPAWPVGTKMQFTRCAILSKRVYDANEQSSDYKMIKRSDSSEHPPPKSGLCWLVARDGSDIYVVFRGSQKIMDFVLDASFLPVTKDGLHGGISAALEFDYEDIITYITKAIEQAKAENPDTPPRVFITGHSLGGALAQLLHKKVYSLYQSTCITFAAPLSYFGCADPPKLEKCYSLINKGDPVPLLPYLLTMNKPLWEYIQADYAVLAVLNGGAAAQIEEFLQKDKSLRSALDWNRPLTDNNFVSDGKDKVKYSAAGLKGFIDKIKPSYGLVKNKYGKFSDHDMTCYFPIAAIFDKENNLPL